MNRKYGIIQIMAFAGLCTLFGSTSAVYLSAKGFSTSVIGTTLASVSAIGVFVQPIVASYSDSHKEIKTQDIITVLGAISIGLALLMYSLGKGSFAALAAFVGMLVCVNSMTPLVSALAFRFEKQGIRINFSRARGLGSASWAVTSYIVLYIAEKMGGTILPLIYVALNLVFLFMLRTFDLPKDYVPVNAEDNDDKEESGPQLSFGAFMAKYKVFMLFIVGSILVYFTHTVTNNFLLSIVTPIGGTETAIGTASFVAAIVELPAMFLFEKIAEKVGGVDKVLIISSFVFVIKHAIVWLAPNVFMIYVASALQIGAYALFLPASVYIANQLCDSSDNNKAQSMVNIGTTASGIAANLAGGVLIDAMGIKPVLFIGVIVSILGAVVVTISMRMVAKQS